MNFTTSATYGGWNRRKLNRILAACVAGLSVSVAVAIGASNIWDSDDSQASVVPATRANPQSLNVNPEDLGFGGLDFDEVLAQQAYQSAAVAALDNSRGLGQPEERAVTSSNVAPLIDELDQGSIGAFYLPQPQYATSADATFAAESARTQPIAVTPGDALGIGQPGESSGIVDPYFGTGSEAVSVLEGDFLGLGQPGEGTGIDPMVGQMVDETYVIELEFAP